MCLGVHGQLVEGQHCVHGGAAVSLGHCEARVADHVKRGLNLVNRQGDLVYRI
jgi:hypothetical protein